MPVSGLVITLTHDTLQREAAIGAIRSDRRIEIGTIGSSKMAIVVDTPSSDDDKQLWEWLQAIDGVLQVEVAMIGFE